MKTSIPDWIAPTIAASLAACLSALALFWAGFCFILGGPDGRIGNEATRWGSLSLVLACVLAYASHLLYVSPGRIAAGNEQTIHHYARRAAPLVAALFILLALALGGGYLLGFAAIVIGIALAVRGLTR